MQAWLGSLFDPAALDPSPAARWRSPSLGSGMELAQAHLPIRQEAQVMSGLPEVLWSAVEWEAQVCPSVQVSAQLWYRWAEVRRLWLAKVRLVVHELSGV